ncbi:MAG TPA: hypothetical protein VK403_11380 [Allosphingosinicella sp.]|nr:hypothetical protein [Allosphingosinicella sp.]
MIGVSRASQQRPADLDWRPPGEARTEADRARDHFLPEEKEGGFKFEVYRRRGVATAVNELFGYKCAYCESRYGGQAPVDVEHYRPKGLVVLSRRPTVTRPGYWWLASDWHNLLASCIDCNRPRTHTIDGDDFVGGKANWFPLFDEASRARAPDEEVAETPLLIDPCLMQPERYLTFALRDRKSIARPVSNDKAGLDYQRGRKTIDVFALNRPQLVEDRTERLARATPWLKVFERERGRMNAGRAADRAAALEAAAEAIAEIKAYVRPTAPWSGAMRAHLREPLAASGITI